MKGGNIKIMRKDIRILFIAVLILGCAYFNIALCDQSSVSSGSNIPCESIIVIEPFIIYENAYNEQNLHAVDINIKNMVDVETAAFAADVLSKSGLKPMTINALDSEQKAAIEPTYRAVQNNSEELVKQWKSKEAFLKDFGLIKNICKAEAALVQFVKVKIGSQGGWDFMFTGAVIPDSSTTSIKAVLLDLKTGQTYWANSSIERTVPNNNSIVKRLLKELYSKFPGYNKKETAR